ncbi:hypothetical protein MMC09_002522 [Bachmanniomyces sp. S44760]|nr:hypothetical protein [Bachmanniomyces sp. S44760]
MATVGMPTPSPTAMVMISLVESFGDEEEGLASLFVLLISLVVADGSDDPPVVVPLEGLDAVPEDVGDAEADPATIPTGMVEVATADPASILPAPSF